MVLKLNDSQEEAAAHFTGPMMVLAGPGSGKTTVITYRILKLIENYNVDPKDILVITFTKSAAIEMKLRYKNMRNNRTDAEIITFGTFHSFFFRIIRRHLGLAAGKVLSENDRRELILKSIKAAEVSVEEDEDFVRDIENEISLIKNELLDIAYYNSPNIGSDDFRSVYKAFESFKNTAGVIDFDDMLIKCYELLCSDSAILEYWQNKYKFILIDEFQDINRVQYECIKLLAKPHENLFIVGDDDQSIFKFRGASPEFLLRFPEDFECAKRITLDINFRSSKRVIDLCAAIISQNKIRYNKQIRGNGKSGGVLKLIKARDVGDEAARIAGMIKAKPSELSFDDYAIVFRTNIQSRAFVDALRDMNVPFQIKDRLPSIYEHWIARDVCSYLRLSLNRSLDNALTRIINRPKRYISKKSIQMAQRRKGGILNNLFSTDIMQVWQMAKIEELIYHLNAISRKNTYDAVKYIRKEAAYDSYIVDYANFRKINTSGLFEIIDEIMESTKNYPVISEYLQYVEASVEEYKGLQAEIQKNGVTLSTMHSVKGLEYDTVFVTGVVDGVIPHERSRLESEIEEERRLLYVAMSRAKNNLYISTIKTRYDTEVKASRFFDKILKKEDNR